jgi:hypothetical protein
MKIQSRPNARWCATAIVVGEIHLGEVDEEGPFGEFAGFMGLVERRPVVRIAAITHREDPVCCDFGLLIKLTRPGPGQSAATALADAIAATSSRFISRATLQPR